MGAFSSDMRQVAKDLCRELGNNCVLTKITTGAYDPSLGKSVETTVDYPVYSAQSSYFSRMFATNGDNTNLSGFNDEIVTVPWFGEVIDTTWRYDGAEISNVSAVKSQNDIIIFNITLHKQE